MIGVEDWRKEPIWGANACTFFKKRGKEFEAYFMVGFSGWWEVGVCYHDSEFSPVGKNE